MNDKRNDLRDRISLHWDAEMDLLHEARQLGYQAPDELDETDSLVGVAEWLDGRTRCPSCLDNPGRNSIGPDSATKPCRTCKGTGLVPLAGSAWLSNEFRP